METTFNITHKCGHTVEHKGTFTTQEKQSYIAFKESKGCGFCEYQDIEDKTIEEELEAAKQRIEELEGCIAKIVECDNAFERGTAIEEAKALLEKEVTNATIHDNKDNTK